jgi:hypothetical protein
MKLYKYVHKFALMIGVSMILLAGCGGGSAEQTDQPAKVVESYITALADGNGDKMAQLSCADWEDDAHLSADSFVAVDTTLKELSCTTSVIKADSAIVDCTGSIEVSYNGENRSVDLAGHHYTVDKQGSDWLVCGQQ